MTSGASGLPDRVGRYEVEVQLGEGRFGRVLIARDPALGRQVAVKILRADPSLDARTMSLAAQRLKEGARTAAALRHPGVLVVHDMGDDERVGAYVVLELVHGNSLRERLVQGRLSRSEVIHLARSLASTLSHAHANGVAHGNIKAENVLLSPAGPKLTDFGGPILPDAEGPASVVGTIAPEILAGGSGSAQGDQFSLAAILFEAATGAPPFPGDDPRVVADSVKASAHDVATSVATDLHACPRIDAIFDRALAKNPGKRFASCEAFTTALCASLEPSQGPFFTPASQSSIVPKTTRRWQNAAAAVAVGVIFALVTLGRQPRPGGVSLRSVASAFASAVGAPDPMASAGGRRISVLPLAPSAGPIGTPGNPKASGRDDGGALSGRSSTRRDRDPADAPGRDSPPVGRPSEPSGRDSLEPSGRDSSGPGGRDSSGPGEGSSSAASASGPSAPQDGSRSRSSSATTDRH